jgi:hypothetical protein
MVIKKVSTHTLVILVLLSLGACGGSDTPSPYSDLSCPTVYQPVCAKTTSDASCTGMNCLTHEYTTYGNGCTATVAGAAIAFEGDCELLENKPTFADNLLTMLSYWKCAMREAVYLMISICFSASLLWKANLPKSMPPCSISQRIVAKR